METGRDDTAWVKVQLQELSNRWDTVCALSVTKQTRLQQALKQVRDAPFFLKHKHGELFETPPLSSTSRPSGGGVPHSRPDASGVAL